MKRFLLAAIAAVALISGCKAPVQIDLPRADAVISEAIDDGTIPGAVLCVVKGDEISFLKAYGNRAVTPDVEPMTTETVFDLASLSKCVSTTLSFMQLVERGYVRLSDPVNRYIPDFKGDINIRHLMTHSSGLDAYVPDAAALAQRFGSSCPDSLMHYIAVGAGRNFEPGSDFLYSCLNFVTLQNILQKLTGERLCDYAQREVFDALGLKHTCYLPGEEMLPLIAPTEVQPDGMPLRGEVHDPLARLLNYGNSGNAGVFSDARDLAVICAAIMNGGEYKGRRILSEAAVEAMCAVPSEIDPSVGRALGWDVYSSHAGIRGDLMSRHHCICHTGYTGTSIVMDLDEKLAVILLTNRVHPEDTGSLTRTRALVANIVAGAFSVQ